MKKNKVSGKPIPDDHGPDGHGFVGVGVRSDAKFASAFDNFWYWVCDNPGALQPHIDTLAQAVEVEYHKWLDTAKGKEVVEMIREVDDWVEWEEGDGTEREDGIDWGGYDA